METDQAFRKFMQSYGSELLRICIVYLRDYQLAEDIVQETFYRIYCRYARTKNSAIFTRSYAVKTAINLCKNQMRSQWFHTIKTDIFPQETPSLPFSSFENSERQDIIFSKILSLKPIYREVILLYYYEEFSIAEISELLKEKESTIKVRLKRARDLLEPELKEVIHERVTEI